MNGRAALLEAYPSHLRSIDGTSVTWTDGTTMPYDDGRPDKSFEQMLDEPDLQDQMSLPYPAGAPADLRPSRNADPGRIRYEPFFRKMYGSTREEVEDKLVVIRWLPSSANVPVRVTTVNGVADKLTEVSREMDKLPPRIRRYVQRLSGSYSWRPIAGTDRLSMHSFGIAIDIDARHADYWMWDKPDPSGAYRYRNRIPREIVDIFERHGFIWGGAWYHYDTMHFEYRPELLIRPAVK